MSIRRIDQLAMVTPRVSITYTCKSCITLGGGGAGAFTMDAVIFDTATPPPQGIVIYKITM